MRRIALIVLCSLFFTGCMTISGMVAGPVTGLIDCPELLHDSGYPYVIGYPLSSAFGVFLGTFKGGMADAVWVYDGNPNLSAPFHPCTPMRAHDWGKDAPIDQYGNFIHEKEVPR